MKAMNGACHLTSQVNFWLSLSIYRAALTAQPLRDCWAHQSGHMKPWTRLFSEKGAAGDSPDPAQTQGSPPRETKEAKKEESLMLPLEG